MSAPSYRAGSPRHQTADMRQPADTRDTRPMHRPSVPWLLIVVAGVALAVFGALTAAVTLSSSLALDSWAFEIADDLRAPWLDAAARVITRLGLIAMLKRDYPSAVAHLEVAYNRAPDHPGLVKSLAYA